MYEIKIEKEGKEMSASKKVSSIITIVLILAFVGSLLIVPNTSAARDFNKKTYAYIGATPNPIGVGEETLLHIGISDELQDWKHGYEGLTVTITKPDNATETLGPFRTDSTGGTGTIYTPTMVGTYYLQTNFPAQWYNWTMFGGANIWFEASKSERLALNVTAEKNPDYPGTPLPTEYWTRPIDAQHYGWANIAGSWVASPANLFAPYNQGPETAHILWRKPLMIGGVSGGDIGIMHYNLGGGGQSPWPNSVILGGVLLYNRYYSGTERNVVAVDLHTGEELWVKNATLSFGQHYQFVASNQYAAFDYWWETSGTNWTAYDPLTGRMIYMMYSVPSGTTVYGPNGEFYRYNVNLRDGYITLWNSTAVVAAGQGGGWSPYGRSYNASVSASQANIWAWNITIPKGLPGSARLIYSDDMILGYYRGGTVLTRVEAGITLDNPPFYAWAISLKPESRGQVMWNKTYPMPPGNLTVVFGIGSRADRVWTVWCKETRSHQGFSLDTGEKLWETGTQAYMDLYGIPGVCGYAAYGKLYSLGYAGIVYAYDIKTGELQWTYEAKDPYNEILWSNNWPLKMCFITDGKLYITHGEHSPNSPLPRGAPFICLDATTGEEVFRINGAFRGAEWGQNPIIGDSVIASWNSYDNQIYGIAKGPSALTVETTGYGVTAGESLVIQGRVTDISPGLREIGIAERFPQGVPAVADESMSDWMKYVYLQFERPTNTIGVTVKLDALDPNGNYVSLGTTTSDSTGFFNYVWQAPDIPGVYKIIATFPGSDAYYASNSETAAYVTEPTPTPTTAAIKPESMADLYFVPAMVGLFVFVAIIGAAIMLMLRKRS